MTLLEETMAEGSEFAKSGAANIRDGFIEPGTSYVKGVSESDLCYKTVPETFKATVDA